MSAPTPEQARTTGEFVACLRSLKEWSGLSYRAIERRARAAGEVLPASTAATMLGRESLPRLDLVTAFARACGADTADVHLWAAARRRLAQARCGSASVLGSDDEPDDGRAIGGDTAVAGSGRAPVHHPRQLPLDVPTFVGRTQEIAELGTVLTAAAADRSGPVIVLHGTPGTGKSALAVRAAHLSEHAFPDGTLYVNLHGATPAVTPMAPLDALGRLLRALGVDASSVPHELDECAALFRSVIAGRRLLLLLDDALSESQLRPLLPGGHETATLITSRARLSGLEGATHRNVGPLDLQAAFSMLRGAIGEIRANADLDAVRRLADVCDYLPLALHVAASRLKTRPTWCVADLVDRMSDVQTRLGELQAGDVTVRSSIGVSSAALGVSDDPLDRSAAEAFTLLGALPVTDIDLSLAGVLFDTSRPEAGRIAERLTEAHLLESLSPQRYRMHDVVRLVAMDEAQRNCPSKRAAALTRVLGYCQLTAHEARRLAHPHRVPLRTPDLPPAVRATPEPLADQKAARRWLEDNRSNLLALASHALRGPDEHARLGLGLVLTMHWFLIHACYPYDGIRLAEQAIVVAERLGDRASVGYAHGMLGAHQISVGRLDDAHRTLTAEASIFRDLGDRFAELRAFGNLGVLELRRCRPATAVAMFEHQLTIARSIGSKIGEMFATQGLGAAYRQSGRPVEAAALLKKALDWAQQRDDGYTASSTLRELAKVHIDLGDLDVAVKTMQQAIEYARQSGFPNGAALLLDELADIWRLTNAHSRADECTASALAIRAASSDARVLP